MASKETKPKKEKFKKPGPTSSHLPEIERFVENTGRWLERAKSREKETKVLEPTSLSELLVKGLDQAIVAEEEAYTEVLNARSLEQRHEAMMKVITIREKALDGTDEEVDSDEEEELSQLDEEDVAVIKIARKKGFLERTFDELAGQYKETKSEETLGKLSHLISQMEVNRRVRFLYDLQKLRIGTTNRIGIYERNYGVQDLFLSHVGLELGRLEARSIKMIDKTLKRSPDREFYEYLTETFNGIGTMMAGCIIAELSAPERFRTVSALWAYCGLSVVGHDIETGLGGHAQRRTVGETSNWNNFLKTKLLGVAASCMIKAQTRYMGTPDEPTKARNVRVLHGYKLRIVTQNNLIREGDRAYAKNGTELFFAPSKKQVETYTKDGSFRGTYMLSELKRRRPGHLNKMANRYMIKMFLADILNKWRELKGYEPLLTYDEAKLRGGIKHGGMNLRKVIEVPTRPKLQ